MTANPTASVVTDAMVEAALTKWYGGREWQKSAHMANLIRDMRAALLAALKAER